ncbi:MAG TPA: inducible mutagenesis protein A, partial [Candidatus Dormibacteraeota bacterium]|nr:inducible mutagenesis protein A [Candidatus Dormibacteraeota bacterium]
MAEELRRLLPKIQGFHKAKPLPFGVTAIDDCLPRGGLPGAGLHEIVPAGGSASAAFGFMMALLARVARSHPIVFVLPAYGLRNNGRPYGHGIRALGLDPNRLILVGTAHRKQTLWALEE